MTGRNTRGAETATVVDGLNELLEAPLVDGIWSRRTHRVSQGSSVAAGSMSYTSPHERAPLDELEEAVLIAMTGASGLTMPDRPFRDPRNGQPIMAKPNLTMTGRTAGSPDNSQGTSFFMINDEGTWFLRRLPPDPDAAFDAGTLLARARQAKVRVLGHRVDVPDGRRDYPAYLDSNRFLSNLPGTTVFLPVVDLSHQYINALAYLLTQPDGARPTLVDDRNYYQPAGVREWVRNGFLNGELKLPLGALGPMRTQIEADLLLQNLMLVANTMGLGAWIHASINPQILLGDPKFRPSYGSMLGFDFVTPPFRLLDVLRWQILMPKYTTLRAHPVGLQVDGQPLIQAACPPYHASMSAAVDAVMAAKFSPGGVYRDTATFDRIYRGDYGAQYLAEAGAYDERVVDCVRAICEYIHTTHGRFPAHADAIHVPGVWLQAHHVEVGYYEQFFRHGVGEAHRAHARRWHASDEAAP